MKLNTQKRSFDCPEEMYNAIMEYAVKNKLYKFGPALLSVIEKGLQSASPDALFPVVGDPS
jgi:hypothetical protein